jgi:hypothetical protein
MEKPIHTAGYKTLLSFRLLFANISTTLREAIGHARCRKGVYLEPSMHLSWNVGPIGWAQRRFVDYTTEREREIYILPWSEVYVRHLICSLRVRAQGTERKGV